ncbi:MAG TPA: succinate dehydrogenase assembly factor 2 [Bauldia sp.]|nr:succinate dehydrogenase assembly factor 2 [Bauldia sp.]
MSFRAWHRGIRETDLILGRFADAHLAGFDQAELDAFEALLDIPDRDLLGWVTGSEPVPPEVATPMLARIIAFHHG